MKLETFKATTMAEALSQVKSAMGPDAVILHTRTYQIRKWMGLRRREIVEITASKNAGMTRRTRPPVGLPAPLNPACNGSVAGMAYGPGSRRNMPMLPSPPITTVMASKNFLETPAATVALIRGVSQEVEQMGKILKDFVNDTRKKQLPNVPEELMECYTQLLQNEVADELAQEIVATLKRELRPEQLTQERLVREKLAEHIERLVPSSGPIMRKKTHGPHVIALVGPTGVGKTTTLAKLAANLKLKERHRVGLITLDTYRIAAVDQLKKYAEIIGSSLKVVSNHEELKDAMASMSNLDFVLIDTAGRSPNDVLKLNELRELLATIQPDEVHLVLSSTSSKDCIDLAVERFTDVRVDRIIFTKLDEAAHVGVVLNVIRGVNKCLSYVTTGQDVPNDIEVGRGRLVARMILGEESRTPGKMNGESKQN